MPTYLEHLGTRLRRMRERKGYTVEYVSIRCGVSQTMVTLVENGQYKPPYSLYEDICLVLGYTTKDLFCGFQWSYNPTAMECCINVDFQGTA